MPVAGALRDRGVRVPRLDTRERHGLVCAAVKGDNESRHPELVGEEGELGQRGLLQVARDVAGEPGQARPELKLARGAPHEESVVLKRAHDAVGDRAVQL